jgi:hypothetical protein
VSIECRTLKSAEVPAGKQASNGLYAIAFEDRQLQEALAGQGTLTLDSTSWQALGQAPGVFSFDATPEVLNPLLPVLMFRFKVRYEWTDAKGGHSTASGDLDATLPKAPDFTRTQPRFWIELGPPATDASEPPVTIRISHGKGS